jgi:hypothetical protein
MLQAILINLKYVCLGFGIYSLCVIANIIASTYYNTSKLKEEFKLNRFIDGIFKLFCIGISTAILAIVATMIPTIIKIFGIVIPDGVEITYTVGTILALYFNAIKKYYTEAYTTVKDIMENKDIVDDSQK